MTRFNTILVMILFVCGGLAWHHSDSFLQFLFDVTERSTFDAKNIELQQMRQATTALTFPTSHALQVTDKDRAKLGRVLFFDTRFSANNSVACSTCHNPAQAFTDGKAVASGIEVGTKNSPTLLNTFSGSWFMWDGRADSLASQALKPIEDPLEHGISRGRVAQLIWKNHRDAYEKNFGPFPKNLALLFEKDPDSDFHALPPAQKLEMPVELAAYAVATIDTYGIQKRFITQAFAANESPQKRLARLAMQPTPENPEWVAQYNSLPEKTRSELNEVFARFGEALAAYESGVVAQQSPFDGFAAKLATAQEVTEALSPSFGNEELQGLALFLNKGCTNCHNGPNFTDQQFHNIGLTQRGEELELGRARGVILAQHDLFSCQGGILPKTTRESCLELDYINSTNFEYMGAHKTPTLRNVAETAPYMHDGRFKDLDAVLRHYNLLSGEPAVGHREESLEPLRVGENDRAALKAFLRSLSSPIQDLNAVD